jgi:NADPH-dependent curcumin reductase CurA
MCAATTVEPSTSPPPNLSRYTRPRYFENVGGTHFEAACASLRPHGRIAVCGAISGYNEAERPTSRLQITQLIYTFQRVEGFVCSPWLRGERGNFLADMASWVKQGKLSVQETFFDGIEAWPDAFASLFSGANSGKVVVRVA